MKKPFHGLDRASTKTKVAFCNFASWKLNISHGGKNDWQRHASSAKHYANKAAVGKMDIAAAMKPANTNDLHS